MKLIIFLILCDKLIQNYRVIQDVAFIAVDMNVMGTIFVYVPITYVPK